MLMGEMRGLCMVKLGLEVYYRLRGERGGCKSNNEFITKIGERNLVWNVKYYNLNISSVFFRRVATLYPYVFPYFLTRISLCRITYSTLQKAFIMFY